jgi:hypothetical protein
MCAIALNYVCHEHNVYDREGQLRTLVVASKHCNAGTGIGGDARCPHAPLAALCQEKSLWPMRKGRT